MGEAKVFNERSGDHNAIFNSNETNGRNSFKATGI
jgi:hypothetical protein